MLEPKLSADGLYYWDGAQWISTRSPDGRTRWNGTAWVPTGQDFASTAYHHAPRTLREPTSWTRPLQYTVAGWCAIYALVSLSLPLWMSGPMADVMNQTIQRQQQVTPTATPLPADFTNTMTSMMTGILWFAALFSFAIYVVAAVGALKRWSWLYYALLILLGLGLASEPVNLINLATGRSPMGASGINMPAWILWVGVVSAIPTAALFAWMIVAFVQRGPWAMKKVTG